MSTLRIRWAAIGAAVAVSLGGGGLGLTHAALSSGSRSVFVPISPCRLFDTRPGPDNVGTRVGPLGAEETLTQQVAGNSGNCIGIPADVTAVALNVTIISPTADSYLTLFPGDGTTAPLASNLNWRAGQAPTPNKVDVKVSPTGTIRVFNKFGTVHVLADIVGYYQDHDHGDKAPRLITTVKQDAFFGFTFASEIDVPLDGVTTTVTTDVPGRWELSTSFQGMVACSGGITDFVLFATIDGVAVPSSAQLFRATGTINTTVRGLTAGIISAGRHTVSVGLECRANSTASIPTYSTFVTSNVVVYPT